MKRIIKITSIALLSVLSTLSIANEDGFNIADELQYDSSKQKSEISISISPLEAWNNYLTKHNLNDGFNERNGRVFFVGFGSEVVGNGGSIVKSPGFLDARTSAYGIALLAAKAELANNLSSELSSERALTMFKISEDAAPAFREKVIKPLSLMDKAHKLTDLALDDQIKKFDPEWTGENKNKEEKLTALRKYILIYSENLSQKTKQFLQGTTPVFNAEGPNHRGNYSVGVGIVWSAKSTKVAEAVYNPYSKTPKGKKKLLTIKDQLKNLNDKELASTYGSRIWWDEKGSPVVVSFASTDDQGFDTTAKRLTSMTARNQISMFVAEQIVADDSLTGGEERQKAYGVTNSYSDQEFQSRIKAKSKQITLKGVNTILYKYLTHPGSGNGMVVNVMAWSPESSKMARGLEKMSKDQKTKMNATCGGGCLGNQEDLNQNLNIQNSTTASPSGQGVASDPDDF